MIEKILEKVTERVKRNLAIATVKIAEEQGSLF